MSITSALRTLFLCLAASAIVLTATIGSASNAPEVAAVPVKAKGYWDASDGRLCPDEVKYGKFEQTITVQDI